MLTTGSLKALLKFPFQGEDWQNRFIIGTAVALAGCFIPILPGLLLAGYALQILRQAAAGDEPLLTEWAGWGQLGVDGLRVFAVNLVYLLPGALVLVGGWGLYFAGSIGLPLWAQAVEEAAGALIGFLLLIGSMGLVYISTSASMLLLLLGAVPLPVATAHLASRGELAAAFRVREWWPYLRANALGYLIAWVVLGGLWSITYWAVIVACYSVMLCFLAPLLAAPASFYLSLIGAALFGQMYRQGAVMAAERQLAMAG